MAKKQVNAMPTALAALAAAGQVKGQLSQFANRALVASHENAGDAIRYGVAGQLGFTSSSYGAMAADVMRISAVQSVISGQLDRIIVNVHAAGTFRVLIFDHVSDAVYKIRQEIELTASASGVNEYTATDFGVVNVLSTDRIGYRSATGIQIKYQATGNDSYVATYTTGNTSMVSPATYGICIAAYVKSQSTPAPVDVSVDISTPKTELFDYSTTALSPEEIISGNWALASTGLQSPSKNASSKTNVLIERECTIENIVFSADFVAQSATAKVGIFRKPYSSGAAGGSAAFIDFGGSKIGFFESWNGVSEFVLEAETALTIPYVENRSYRIEIRKATWVYTVRLTDLVTGISQSYQVTHTAYAGNGWDYPGVAYLGGQFEIRRMSMYAASKAAPLLAIYGDSLIEGMSIKANFADRYCALIKTALSDNVMIAGRGGEDSGSFISKIPFDVDAFYPKYAIVALGTNDAVYATWLANMQQIITHILARGTTPILTTFAPRSTNQAFLTQANAWVRSSGHPYIDIAYAVTNSNDSVTWGAGMEVGDGIHPSVAGHLAIYNRAKVDLPWLLD